MRKYHPLTVTALRNETADSMRAELSVPAAEIGTFDFLPGQHLPLQLTIDGKRVRRTYSICSVPGHMPLEIAIRIQPGGQFSEYVANEMRVGDRVEVMPPFGQFHADLDADKSRCHLAFAAGSGITPILSIMRATLENELHSRFVLFYGNRRQQTTMFIDDLYALKNRFPERLQLYFLFSQEEQEFEIFSGRLDSAKVTELYKLFCADLEPDEAYVCGPDTMLDSVQSALSALGMDEQNIHIERYGAPRKINRTPDNEPAPAVAGVEDQVKVNVILDGHQKSFEMPREGVSIVDAAAVKGIDLPYSCKGGVCATCRTHVRDGDVRMATNYGLEPWEVDKGFVLACQSTPLSDVVTLDYDKT